MNTSKTMRLGRFTAILLAALLLIGTLPAMGASELTATPTTQAVLVNGVKTPFDAYNIGGNNYFKLRDIAYVLNGTSKQFSVDFDSAANAITLTSGHAYIPIGGEMVTKDAEAQKPVPSAQKVYLDGALLNLTAYNIGNSNYFKLRDPGAAFNFGADWDAAAKTVVIDTNKGYTPEAAANGDWAAAYIEVLNANRTGIRAYELQTNVTPKPKVAIIDITGNGTPELLFMTYDRDYYLSVWTYSNGIVCLIDKQLVATTAQVVGQFCVAELDNNKLLVYGETSEGYSTYTYKTITLTGSGGQTGDTLEQRVTGSGTSADGNIRWQYTLNGTIITESQHEAEKQKLINAITEPIFTNYGEETYGWGSKGKTDPDGQKFSGGNAMTCDAALAYLQSQGVAVNGKYTALEEAYRSELLRFQQDILSNPEFYYTGGIIALSAYSYAFYDIDGNGIVELILIDPDKVSAGYAAGDVRKIFTLRNGTPLELIAFENYFGTGIESSDIKTDGTITHASIGRASGDSTLHSYRITQNGDAIQEVETTDAQSSTSILPSLELLPLSAV